MITLRKYQETSYNFLKNALFKYGSAIDASDTGTGKTYVAVKLAKDIGLYTLVLSPKSLISKWQELLAEAGVKEFDVITLERFILNYTKNKYRGGLLIWDECHRGQANYSTKTAKIMAQIKNKGYIVLLLSATAISNPIEMRATASILGLCEPNKYFSWMLNNGCVRQYWGGFKFKSSECYLQRLHSSIFDAGKGARVRISDLAGEFPENSILIDAIDVDDKYTKEIDKLGDGIKQGFEDQLGGIIKMRMLIEESKSEYIIEKAKDIIKGEGKNVVIFTSFISTLKNMVDKLASEEYIRVRFIFGETTKEDRAEIVEQFQSNKINCLVCQLACGGVALSLHDLTGDRPRTTLINPDFSARNLKQVLGRIHRIGGVSQCVQRIIIARGTIEEKIINILERGIKELTIGNDGSLENEDLMSVFNEYKKGKNK
jgi:superfamily II DNA or RNA helicase